jgi:hypothetical protein
MGILQKGIVAESIRDALHDRLEISFIGDVP